MVSILTPMQLQNLQGGSPEAGRCSWLALAWRALTVGTTRAQAQRSPAGSMGLVQHRPLELPEIYVSEVRVPRVALSTSPVTVTHALTCVECVRPPSCSQQARTLRAEAADILLVAYCQLVHSPYAAWSVTDIFEEEARHSPNYRDVVVRSPEQDALGVLAGANAVMRYILNDNFLLEHGIDLEVRYWLAATLFLVYKVKTGDCWREGDCMTMLVLEQFLNAHELGNWRTCKTTRKERERCMWDAEASILICQPFGALVSRGVHSAFEVACAQLMEAGELTRRDAVVGVGIVHFYLHAAHVNERRDILEELAVDRCVEEIGASLAFIVLVTLRLSLGLADSVTNLAAAKSVWNYDTRMLNDSALQLVRNGKLVSSLVKTPPLGGAYACPKAFVYNLVSPQMLHMLITTLSAAC